MKIEEIIDTDQYLLEMANLTKRMTGLPINIYVLSKDAVNDRHGPRIKAMTHYGNSFDKSSLTSVSISKNPIDFHEKLEPTYLNLVKQFVIDNHDALLAHWNNELDIGELINVLKTS